mmetsp:Transcript_20464/g.26468  ORF Transcript_20464/g.26468 Transcript_20464/m.26468 type:complete len:80 (-) Transcript_20464:81-320(-)
MLLIALTCGVEGTGTNECPSIIFAANSVDAKRNDFIFPYFFVAVRFANKEDISIFKCTGMSSDGFLVPIYLMMPVSVCV